MRSFLRLILLSLVIFLAGFLGAFIHSEKGLVFYAGTRDGVIEITSEATKVFSQVRNSSLSVWEGRLYDRDYEYVFESGKILATPLKVDWSQVAGFGKLVKIDNTKDTVTFYNMEGKLIAEYGMLVEPNKSNQNTNGLFLEGDTFILSDNGANTVLKYSLKSGEIKRIGSSPDSGWLGAIYFDRGYNIYYIASGDRIFKFTEGQEMELVARGLPANVTGIVVVGRTIYFTSNFGNGFYSYGIDNGKTTLLAHLNYPQSLVALPAP